MSSFESLSWKINTNGILSLANNYLLNSSKKKNSNKNSKLILSLIVKATLGEMLLTQAHKTQFKCNTGLKYFPFG